MRPRYLEIEGLQSFKELQKIDFDKLSETGLFGIFGPTGSGKSTILDAITLALYGSVHRAKGTQGIINTDMSTLRVSFTFNLIKEGLIKTYRVERQYKRKKDSDNSIEIKLTRLLEIADEQEYILSDKHSEINNHIIQLLGLKFEDFTRSVVLPQNKFQEFLLSQRSEKTKMLERIFYLEEYGRRLVDKVNKEVSAVKNKLSNIEGALSTLGISSPEALIEAERNLTLAQELRIAAANKQKAVEERYSKGMEKYKLSREYEALQQKLKEYNEKQAKMQELEDACLKSEAANAIKPLMLSYIEAKKSYKETAENLSLIEEKLKALESEKAALQQGHDFALNNKDQRLPELIRYKTMLQECEILQQETDELLKLLNIARKEYADIGLQLEAAKKNTEVLQLQKEELNKGILVMEEKAERQQVSNDTRKLVNQGMALETELQGLKASLVRQADKYDELYKNLQTYQNGHIKAQEELNKGLEHLASINKQKRLLEETRPINREEIAEQQSRISVAEGLLQNITLSCDYIKSLEDRYKDFTNQEYKLQAAIEKAEICLKTELIEEADNEGQLNALIKHQKLHTSALLAKSLIEGGKCPVCGSKEHPEPAVDAFDESSALIEQRQNELQAVILDKQKQIRDLELELIRLKQQYSSQQQTAEQLSLELQSKRKEYQNQRLLLPEAVKSMETKEIQAYITAEKAALNNAALEYSSWEEKLLQYNDEIKKQELALSELKIQESRMAALLDNTKTAIAQEHAHLEECRNSHAEAAEKHKKMLERLNADSFLQEADSISKMDEQSQSLAAAIKQSRGKLDALTKEQQSVLEKTNEINEILSEKKSEGLKLKEQKEIRDKKIIGIIGDKNLGQELKLVIKDIDSLEAANKKALEELNAARNSFEEAQRRRSGLQSSLENYKQKLESDSKLLQKSLRDKGFSDETQVEACLLEDDRFKYFQEELARYKRDRGSTEDRLHSITKQLEGKLLDEEQWQRLCNENEHIKAELEASISQLEAAKNNYQRIKECFEKWISLQEELKSISKKKDMLEQIQKLLKGNGFIEFISEERMRYIAREASETLGELTKYRYSIELDSENGFVIRDNSNGGVLRSIASLSGGETFLTSLSLALALSSQLQLKGQSPLEFFFLDEGFGTLDNTLLDTVIDSLERLSSSKRVIGLISHVPEMKNRINRRLIVEAPDRSGTGSKILIEKA